MHELYPQARLYGTERHTERFPKLPWEVVRSEDPELHEWYADDFGSRYINYLNNMDNRVSPSPIKGLPALLHSDPWKTVYLIEI